ncbi:hypothetical protein [Endozoicomonas sp. 2B-B]
MDGRIGPATIKHAFDDNPLHSGFSARLAKLDLSSEANNNAGICTEVRSQLKRSPSSQRMPDKKRTVSSTDSSRQKATHSFDFRFVDSDDEVRRLLSAQTDDAHRDVTVISHPDDLSQANLVSRLSIATDGRHTLGFGKLFEGSRPLTLVMDIRKLTSDELPKFNDLLDPDSACTTKSTRRNALWASMFLYWFWQSLGSWHRLARAMKHPVLISGDELTDREIPGNSMRRPARTHQ